VKEVEEKAIKVKRVKPFSNESHNKAEKNHFNVNFLLLWAMVAESVLDPEFCFG
jgi:hypothetical protein